MIDMKSYMTNLMLNGKNILRIGMLLCGVFFLSFQEAKASHIVGGNITYRCLGPDQFGVNSYEIRMTMRRDCFLGASNAPFDDPASIGVFDAVTNQIIPFVGFNGELRIPRNHIDTLNEILVSDCSVIAGDVCVEVTTYIDTIKLPFLAHGYILAYQRCCRNASITNLINPDDTGMTLTAEISAFAQQTCNSSPVFNGFPPIYICANKALEVVGNASDPEGDSLKYSLCIPYAGGDKINNMPQPPPPPPYPHVIYRPPYTIDNLLGGISLKIDTTTGKMTMTATTVGQFIVGICVTAYDRTTKRMTGQIRRDFQFNVRACREVAQAQFSAQSLTCNGLTVSFHNDSKFSDIYKWVFDADDWANSDTSSAFEPTYTFPHSGFYNVALVARDQFGFCHDTAYQLVGVFNDQINAAFTYDVSSCTSDGVVLNVHDQSSGFGNYSPCDWAWVLTVNPTADGNTSLFPSTQTNPSFQFDLEDPATAFLTMQVTSCDGCTATAAQSFPIREITIPFPPGGDSICRGDTAILLQNCDPDLTYTWAPGNGLCATCGTDGCAIAYPGVSDNYFVTVTDGLCSVTGSTHIGVQQLPNLAFDYTTDCKSLEVQFQNGSTGGTNYHWNFGDTPPGTSNVKSPKYTYSTPGNYTVTLSSADGCNVDTTLVITANAITDTLGNTTLSCFKDSVQLNPDFNPAYTYSWSPAQFLNNPNSPNPKAGVDTNTWFYVTITQAGLLNCEIVDSILVESPDDFFIHAPEDRTTCRFDSISLLANTNVDTSTLNLVWTDSSGVVVGHGLQLDVIPLNTITYTITATNELGCSTSDEVTIFKPAPDFTVNTNNDTSYCNIQTITLSATSNVSPITFFWLNAAHDTIGEGPDIQVTPGLQSCYSVVGTDSLGCQTGESVCLTPTFFDVAVTGTQTICLGGETTLCVTDNNNQNLSYTWVPAGCDGTIHAPCITVCPEDTTSYSVSVTNNDVGCVDTLTTAVVVSLFDPLIFNITTSNDTIILTNNGQLMVTLNQPTKYHYVWSSTSAGEVIDPVWNPLITPIDTGQVTYTVTVTNEDGCTATASITIRVLNPACNDSDIFLPNAFTPNNDGNNDILKVRSNFLLSFEIHIYSRWGEEVFTSTDQNMGWDGTFKGKKLEPDVFGYYYSAVCVNQATHTKKGNVTLLK
jgi:gliding motility-associated-like protein